MGRFGAPFFILPAPIFNKLPFSILPPLLTVAWIYGKIKKVMIMENKKQITADKSVVTTKDIVKASFKGFAKKHKIIFAFIIIVAVLVLSVASMTVLVNTENTPALLVRAFFPSELSDDSFPVTFYSEYNPDYDRDNPLAMYNYYYYPDNDESAERVYLDGGYYIVDEETGEDSDITLWFFIETAANFNRFADIAYKVLGVLAAVGVLLLIFAWYRSFKKQELAKKEAYRKSHPRH